MNPRVLLVDDDGFILRSLERVLHHHCDVDVVATLGPKEALEQLDCVPFAVMVSDAALPGLSGGALLALAATRWPAMWRVLYTGRAVGDGKDEFIPGAEFADAVLSKGQEPAIIGDLICHMARHPRESATP